jgi:hypothetical protein
LLGIAEGQIEFPRLKGGNKLLIGITYKVRFSTVRAVASLGDRTAPANASYSNIHLGPPSAKVAVCPDGFAKDFTSASALPF